jgi:hypothetical protein
MLCNCAATHFFVAEDRIRLRAEKEKQVLARPCGRLKLSALAAQATARIASQAIALE